MKADAERLLEEVAADDSLSSANQRKEALVKGGTEVAKGVVDVVAAGVAATGLALSLPSAFLPAAVLAGAAFAVKQAIDYVVDRRGPRNGEAFLLRLVQDVPDRTPEEVKGLIEANINEPFVAETLFATIRKLVDTPHECVAGALGTLAADYIGKARSPDGFLRGLAQMLAHLSEAEFRGLQELARLCPPESVAGEHAELWWRPIDGHPNRFVVQRRVYEPSSEPRNVDLGDVAEARTLFQQLKANCLGDENATGVWGALSGPQIVVVRIEVLQAIGRVVR